MQASWLLFPTSLTSCPVNLKAPLKLWSSCPVYAPRWGAQAESMGSPTTPRQPSGLCLTPDPNSLSSWQMPQVHLAQALERLPKIKTSPMWVHTRPWAVWARLFFQVHLLGLGSNCGVEDTCAVDELSSRQHPSPLPTVPLQEAFFPGTVSMLLLWAATSPATNWNQAAETLTASPFL